MLRHKLSVFVIAHIYFILLANILPPLNFKAYKMANNSYEDAIELLKEDQAKVKAAFKKFDA